MCPHKRRKYCRPSLKPVDYLYSPTMQALFSDSQVSGSKTCILVRTLYAATLPILFCLPIATAGLEVSVYFIKISLPLPLNARIKGMCQPHHLLPLTYLGACSTLQTRMVISTREWDTAVTDLILLFVGDTLWKHLEIWAGKAIVCSELNKVS